MLTGLSRVARRLLRAPAFTIPATMTLWLGIGGTAAAFAVVYSVLLRPLPYPDPERLVDLSHTLRVSGVSRVDQSDATYLLYRRDSRAFAGIGAWRAAAVNLRVLGTGRGGDGPAERVTAAQASAGLFGVLHATPLLGRLTVESDDEPGATPVVVIGQRLWERSWGRDRAVLGRRVLVDGVEREIVGVLPASFHFPGSEPALWLPLGLDPARTRSAAFDYRAIGRLRDGISLGAAAADLQGLLPRVPEVFPGRLTARAIEVTRMQAEVRPLRDVMIGDVGKVLWVVLGGVVLLLLVACANVANLFLARAEGRQRELAVRRALGAGRGTLFAEQVSEALLLAGVSGVLALAAAAAALKLLPATGLGASIPRLAEVGVDGVVFLVTAVAAALAAVCAAAAPVLRRGTLSLAGLLGSNSPATGGGRARTRVRRGLVVAQVALALVLISAAGLLARSFTRLRAVDAGFTSAGALTFRLALPVAAYPTAPQAARLIVQSLDSLLALPGVTAAGVASKLPLDIAGKQDSALFVEDFPLEPGVIPNVHPVVFASPGYFPAMGIELKDGRGFAAVDPSADPASLPRELIVSEALARRYWHGAPVIGKRIRFNPIEPWSTIVGVATDVRDAALAQPPDELVYSPLLTRTIFGAPWLPRDVAFVVRAGGHRATLEAGVSRTLHALDSSLPPYRVQPLDELLSVATARTTVTALLLAVAAMLALAIGATGIYGVAAYLVTLRTREIGVRVALGAGPAEVRRLILGHVVTDAGIGVAVGLAGAALLSRLMRAVLYEASPVDPVVMAGAAIVLLTTAIAAGLLPARRAVALDPMAAFRVD